MKSTARDIQLDLYRGMIMMYILCVIHVTYWLNVNYPPPIKSAMLFEMPVIFFISGASLQITGTNRSFLSNSKNRIKRVLLPFYVYLGILIIGYFILSEIANFLGNGVILPALSLNYRNIIVPNDSPINLPFMYHLWFIVPFLLIYCSFSIQKKAAIWCGNLVYILCAFLLFSISCFTNSILLREMLGYNVFFMAGYFYYKKLSVKNIFLILVISAIAILISTQTGIPFSPMQLHKFPPDMYFIMFGTCAISLLGLLFTFVKIPNYNLIQQWNRNGYTIYLWQSVVFLIVNFLDIHIFKTNSLVRAIALMFFVFVIATVSSYILAPIEKYAVKLLLRGYHWILKQFSSLDTIVR